MCACRETCLRAGGGYRRVGDRGMTRGGQSRLLYKNGIAYRAKSAKSETCLGAGGCCRFYRQCGMPERINVAIDVRATTMAGMGGVSFFGAGGRGKRRAIIVPECGNGSLGC